MDFSATTASIHTMTSADHEYMDYDNDTYKRVLELKEKYKNDTAKFHYHSPLFCLHKLPNLPCSSLYLKLP